MEDGKEGMGEEVGTVGAVVVEIWVQLRSVGCPQRATLPMET